MRFSHFIVSLDTGISRIQPGETDGDASRAGSSRNRIKLIACRKTLNNTEVVLLRRGEINSGRTGACGIGRIIQIKVPNKPGGMRSANKRFEYDRFWGGNDATIADTSIRLPDCICSDLSCLCNAQARRGDQARNQPVLLPKQLGSIRRRKFADRHDRPPRGHRAGCERWRGHRVWCGREF